MLLGTRIAELRRVAGLTQAELAEAVESSPATIAQYEQGVRTPSLRRLAQIAAALGVHVESFFLQR